MSNAVLTKVVDGIATLTLNKPEKLNAWDTPMRGEVADHLKAWKKTTPSRPSSMTDPRRGSRLLGRAGSRRDGRSCRAARPEPPGLPAGAIFYNAIRDLDKPLLAALNGVAAGSAFQVALLCDIRIGHAGTRMGQPEINSGIPSVTGPMLMLSRIGLSRTIELTLSGRRWKRRILAIGLLQHLVASPAEVMPKALAVASELAQKPAIAMRLNKRRFRQVTEEAFEEASAMAAPIRPRRSPRASRRHRCAPSSGEKAPPRRQE